MPGQRYGTYLESELLAHERPRSAILAAYDHLAVVSAQTAGGLKPEHAARAVELFFVALGIDGDPALAARLFASLRASRHLDVYHSAATTVLAALGAQENQPDLHPSLWPAPLFRPLSTGELGEFVRDAIVTRQLAGLLACGTKSVLLETAGIAPLPQPVLGAAAASDTAITTGWIERYPPELHPALRRLAALSDEAEGRVARWLADAFPDAGRLEREIGAIEARLQQIEDGDARQPALSTRLSNLRERLARPTSPGAPRLERLRSKLDRAWGRAVLDRWESDLDARLPEALHRLLGLEESDPLPESLAAPGPLALLAAACRLRGSRRALAFRLFRLRCGPPPWDLRDAPQNRAFVARHPHLDWRPWIDGVGTQTVEAANGRRLHLALEDDPLAIFRMGGNFQTCLSPGAMNYFSVFANAADINKRVLYARDDSGRILGGCLKSRPGSPYPSLAPRR